MAYAGVLDIGPAKSALPGLWPLLYNAKKQGVIQKNAVTIALIREGIRSPDLPGGTITYGNVDTKNCAPNVKYMKAIGNDSSIVLWDRGSFDGFEAPRPTGDVWKADFGFETFGQRFEIPGSEVIRPLDVKLPNDCIFNVFGVDIFPGFFSVGAALARKYWLVFDYDNVQLGFSENFVLGAF
ncbi:aspartic protease 9 [Aphelenchoides avenae]|nr:aspartic protease 9 [Aphelenchus avenae]